MEAVIVFVPTANRSPLPTHAPRVGCDCFVLIRYKFLTRFNSRTPCGVRLLCVNQIQVLNPFQFTHPVWGATAEVEALKSEIEFQFTHPVWGATGWC